MGRIRVVVAELSVLIVLMLPSMKLLTDLQRTPCRITVLPNFPSIVLTS